MGAAHGLELPFVFGTLRPAMARLTGSGPGAAALSQRMMDAWIAFARSGDPSCPSNGSWPAYDAATRATMELDAESRVTLAPFEEERQVWESLL
jgi:para-nitrobenzyl esterase